ncbi:MAG: hypothetical protein HYW63_04490 [Candidatus Levybacteria bacterium]|nr:hypothetical protein [Candidatus Levybacteria bacterium]
MELVLPFLAGAFLTMSVPYIVLGMQGKALITPLAKNSSALTSVVYGYVTLLIGAWIFSQSGRSLTSVLSFDNYSLSFILGSFVIALVAAWMFSNPNAKFPWFK